MEEDDDAYNGAMAVDNDLNTRWASYSSDEEWLTIDMGKTNSFSTVAIFWEGAYAIEYIIQTSNDKKNWTDIYQENAGDGELDLVSVEGTGRYIRIKTMLRATEWGNSIYELGIYE